MKLESRNVLRGLGWALPVAYLPGVWQGAEAARTVVMCVGLALAIGLSPRLRTNWALIWLLTWAAISLAWAPLTWDGLWGLLWLGGFAGLFALGGEVEIEGLFEAVAWGLCANVGLETLQWFGWHPALVREVASPAGLFGNRDTLAQAILPVAIWAIARRKWGFGAVLTLGMALAQCREVWGIGALAFVLWHRTAWPRLTYLGMAALGLGLALGLVFWPSLHADALNRVDLWLDTMAGVTFWGHGIGQFYGVWPEFATRLSPAIGRPDHAHLDGLEVLYELGVPGLALMGWLLAEALLADVERWARFALVSILGESLAAFPFYENVTMVLLALLAGRAYWAWARAGRGAAWSAGCAVLGAQGA